VTHTTSRSDGGFALIPVAIAENENSSETKPAVS